MAAVKHIHSWDCRGGVYGCHLEGEYPQDRRRASRYTMRLIVAVGLAVVVLTALVGLAVTP